MPSVAAGVRSRALFVLVVVSATALVAAPGAFAARGGKGGGSGSSGAGLSPVSESVWSSPNPAAPTWCANEDDSHRRIWSGSLDGTFAASERLCDATVDYSGGFWWTAGGEGVQSDVYVTGTLSDLAITSPGGDSHHAVLVASSTSKGVTTDHYQVCYAPPFSISSNVGGWPLRGGAWQITLSGNISKVTFSVWTKMMYATFQEQYCPPSSQNLVP